MLSETVAFDRNEWPLLQRQNINILAIVGLISGFRWWRRVRKRLPRYLRSLERRRRKRKEHEHYLVALAAIRGPEDSRIGQVGLPSGVEH